LAEVHPNLHPFVPNADNWVPQPTVTSSRPTESAGEGAVPSKLVASAMLTPREAQVLELLVHGLSNKEIARCLEIGDGTIKWHLKNLFIKLGAVSRKTAVSRAKLLGLVSSD
ncbi:MAG: LuxR C-terminal-related transcriptional regulator, partial [Desulfobacterales bacterium]|nr:LuxR C-terminal-related transcriptional regulator [Desulfobacterales bacterium]